jgi:uncharacterized membrane protein
MNRTKAILVGTITGTITGFTSVGLTAVAWLFLANQIHTPGHWDSTVTIILLSFGLVQGAIIGGINGGLCPTLCHPEQVIVSVLLSLAIGAVRVLTGGFDSQSLLPVVIFGLAFINGGLTAAVLLIIFRRMTENQHGHLLIN